MEKTVLCLSKRKKMMFEHGEQSTILVVDDNPTNLKVLLDSLKELGFKTLVARSGEAAIRQVEYAKPDVILLDVMMPGIDGFETCRRLKTDAATKDIPVIFMTALTETVDKLKGFEVGGVDYITKPLQHEEVLARVNAHLTIRKLQQQLQMQNMLLQKKNAQLEELNASKDKFFSIIAHDLRSPLSGLLAVSYLLADEFDKCSKDESREMINLLQNDVKNLYKLLENLLTWSRLQRGMMEFQPQSIDLNELISRNIFLFAPNAEQKNIILNSLVQEKLMAYADVNMVDTIIRNVLSNALKFTDSGGKIDVSATQGDQFVEISVSDTGVGIHEENLSKLFRIDVRYQKKGTAGEQGTGLGLNLCKELIRKNGGRIWVESEVGKGTMFTFTLPTRFMEEYVSEQNS
jgi:signal transduction histidine kinase